MCGAMSILRVMTGAWAAHARPMAARLLFSTVSTSNVCFFNTEKSVWKLGKLVDSVYIMSEHNHGNSTKCRVSDLGIMSMRVTTDNLESCSNMEEFWSKCDASSMVFLGFLVEFLALQPL